MEIRSVVIYKMKKQKKKCCLVSFATLVYEWMQNLQIWWMIKGIFATLILIDRLFVFMGIILSQKKNYAHEAWAEFSGVVKKILPISSLQGPLMFPHPKAWMGNSKILCVYSSATIIFAGIINCPLHVSPSCNSHVIKTWNLISWFWVS